MADFQPQGQNWSGQNPVIGTGEGEVPLAKPPIADMTMRTMGSDISSMKTSGGGEPRPYAPKEVSYSAPTGPASSAPQMPVTPQMQQSYTAPSASPQMNFGNVAPVNIVAQAVPAKSGSALFITLAAIITSIGLGAVGYFFVYPQFAAPAAPAVTEQPATTAPAPGAETPATTPPATTTAVTEPIPPATTAPATTTLSASSSAPTASELPTVSAHVSALKTAADFSAEATLSSIALDAVKTALTSSPVEVPVLKEITFKDASGKVYAFAALSPLFMPSTFTPSTLALFNPDVSFITYTDKTGSWPAIVLQLATGADAAAAKTAVAAIEKNSEYQTLFITDPGTASTWKDGKVANTPARYIAFSKQGVAFNYTWLGTKLVISSSYAGAQEIAKRIAQ